MNLVFVVVSIISAVAIVEVAGYFWHRWAEHQGMFGRSIVKRHIHHHNKDYPSTRLRPKQSKYKSARSWSWYLLAAILILAMYLSVPRPYNFVMIVAGLVYAKFVINYLHSRFHIQDHWLSKNKRFIKIQKLHDIHHWGPYNYGIAFYGMDWLLGTYQEDFPTKKVNNFKTQK